jgi:hypothetical protein
MKALRFVPYSVISTTLWAIDRAIPHATILGVSSSGVTHARAMRDGLEEYWETDTPVKAVLEAQEDTRAWVANHSPLAKGGPVSGLYLGLDGSDAARLKRLLHLVRKSALYTESSRHNELLAAERWWDLLISV